MTGKVKLNLTAGEQAAIVGSVMWPVCGRNYAKFLHYALLQYLNSEAGRVDDLVLARVLNESGRSASAPPGPILVR